MDQSETFGPQFGQSFQDQLRDLFVWRRDVRRFRRDPLPSGVVEELLSVANLAPSVGLSQPWRFVNVVSAGLRAAVRADFEHCNAEALAAYSEARAAHYAHLKLEGLNEAPCHIAVFSDADAAQGYGLGRKTMPETLNYSTVMAIHTLWLAARARNIGLGWISILDPRRIKEILDVPATWDFIGYFCVGYPATESQVPELERVGWESRQAPHILRR